MTYLIGRSVLRILGWKIDGSYPTEKKFIIIVAPHISNWDFVIGIAVMWTLRIKIHYLGKSSIFIGPFGWWLRRIGGIPVHRSKAMDLVQQLKKQFDSRDEIVLAIAPEGTRSYRDCWKSGFYHMAVGCQLPVLVACMDQSRKVLTLGHLIDLEGDPSIDMDHIRAFYHRFDLPAHPKFGPIRLSTEDR